MLRVAHTRTMEYSGTLKMLVAVLLEAVAWVVRGQKLVLLDFALVEVVLGDRHRNRQRGPRHRRRRAEVFVVAVAARAKVEAEVAEELHHRHVRHVLSATLGQRPAQQPHP